jgi:hypothetical protein
MFAPRSMLLPLLPLLPLLLGSAACSRPAHQRSAAAQATSAAGEPAFTAHLAPAAPPPSVAAVPEASGHQAVPVPLDNTSSRHAARATGRATAAPPLRDPSNPAAPEGAPAPPGDAAVAPGPGGHEHHEPPGQHEHHGQQPAGGEGSAGQGAAVFACPMHPEVTSDAPGRCPTCGMNLEPKKSRE